MSATTPSRTSGLSRTNTPAAAIEKAILKGDLRALTEIERLQYNVAICRALGLDPVTRPFDYILQDGKMSLYLNANGTAQLRALQGISTCIVGRHQDVEMCYVTCVATDRAGRSEEATAVVPLVGRDGKPLTGQAKANAMMKAETKSKRRATLALAGIPNLAGANCHSERWQSTAIDPPLDLLPDAT
ncbi:hypothetical protein [Rubidibacter lacunae]|nr:hypothetical protein [Rubidibacter lacunae]